MKPLQQNESVNTLDIEVQKVSNKFFSEVHISRGNLLVSLNEISTQRATAVAVPRAGTLEQGNRRDNFQVKFSAKLFDLKRRIR